jgi:hypothetical protein
MSYPTRRVYFVMEILIIDCLCELWTWIILLTMGCPSIPGMIGIQVAIWFTLLVYSHDYSWNAEHNLFVFWLVASVLEAGPFWRPAIWFYKAPHSKVLAISRASLLTFTLWIAYFSLLIVLSIVLVINLLLVRLYSLALGVLEVPSKTNEIFKVPTSHYEFGANYLDSRVS